VCPKLTDPGPALSARIFSKNVFKTFAVCNLIEKVMNEVTTKSMTDIY
jgi:hypothetical protein